MACRLYGKPEILNSDQGCQFTSDMWIQRLELDGVRISMDGKGRWADNIIIERFWRSLKYEAIFLACFEDVAQVVKCIKNYIEFYNNERPHQALKYKTPNEIFFEINNCVDKDIQLCVVLGKPTICNHLTTKGLAQQMGVFMGG